jgi:hypothetical protein
MLNDDKLWASLKPIIESIKVFSKRMEEEADKPVTKHTGKSTEN